MSEYNPLKLGRHSEEWELYIPFKHKRRLGTAAARLGMGVTSPRKSIVKTRPFSVDVAGLRSKKCYCYSGPQRNGLVLLSLRPDKGDKRVSFEELELLTGGLEEVGKLSAGCHFDLNLAEPIFKLPSPFMEKDDSPLGEAWGNTLISGLELTFDGGSLDLNKALFYLGETCLHLHYLATLTIAMSSTTGKTIDAYTRTVEQFFVREKST